MTSDEADEVLGIVQRIGPVVLSSAVDMSSTVGTSLRRCVGMLMADFNMTNLPTFSIAFTLCLDLARHCYATLTTMDRVRKAALAEAPKALPATQTVLAIVRLTLACEARIISFMSFRSREDVEAVAVAMNDAFTQTSEVAADDLDAATYMAITRLHGDVTRHLADRGRRLPRVISYNYQMVMPALRMAQRAYGEPSRYQELVDENSVVHPAFMPRSGKMLAVA
jgi:prophage DNA circulation protein